MRWPHRPHPYWPWSAWWRRRLHSTILASTEPDATAEAGQSIANEIAGDAVQILKSGAIQQRCANSDAALWRDVLVTMITVVYGIICWKVNGQWDYSLSDGTTACWLYLQMLSRSKTYEGWSAAQQFASELHTRSESKSSTQTFSDAWITIVYARNLFNQQTVSWTIRMFMRMELWYVAQPCTQLLSTDASALLGIDRQRNNLLTIVPKSCTPNRVLHSSDLEETTIQFARLITSERQCANTGRPTTPTSNSGLNKFGQTRSVTTSTQLKPE